ncbi:hypothetical protein DPEC_G00183010 [Dallia pectoralis]|uniref:Uncharacterized protein n=1 Tax=Dallia pectoralis TaxID=75939 RepID=A0ACC2GAP5_DALPE|nr:hypothetical protein DPEC_G00183010 [Dallia pectoralis]
MDNIIFRFLCPIVLLGLVLTSTIIAQNTTATSTSATVLTINTGNKVNSKTTVEPDKSVGLTESGANTKDLKNIDGGRNISESIEQDKKQNNDTIILTATSSMHNGSTTNLSGGNTTTIPARITKTTFSVKPTATTKKPVQTSALATSTIQSKASKVSGSRQKAFWITFLVLVLLVLLVMAIFHTRKKLKRKSMDLSNRQEDVPLSCHEQDVVFDNSAAPKEMQTFTAVDLNSTEALVDDSSGTQADGGVSTNPAPPSSPADKPNDVAPTDVAPRDELNRWRLSMMKTTATTTTASGWLRQQRVGLGPGICLRVKPHRSLNRTTTEEKT